MNLPDHIHPIAVEEALLDIGMTINEIRELTRDCTEDEMRWEYRIEEWSGTYWYPCEPWASDLSQYDGYTARKGERLVRRLAGPVEEVSK